jgi:hypothetical protein
MASGPPGRVFALARVVFGLLGRVTQDAGGYAGILIQGETGSGRECIAIMMHPQPPRSNKPFLARNYAAIPANMSKSEMFGHEEGRSTQSRDAIVIVTGLVVPARSRSDARHFAEEHNSYALRLR